MAVSETGWVVILGGGAMLGLTILQAKRMWSGAHPFGSSFTRTFGLVFVASLAALLVVTTATTSELTAAFTLLGAIAGHLVGAKQEASTTTTSATDGTQTTITE